MELTDEQLTVLGIFKEYGMGINHFLLNQHLYGKRDELPRPIQDTFGPLLNDLVEGEYLEFDLKGYWLTQKGYDRFTEIQY